MRRMNVLTQCMLMLVILMATGGESTPIPRSLLPMHREDEPAPFGQATDHPLHGGDELRGSHPPSAVAAGRTKSSTVSASRWRTTRSCRR